MAKHVSNTIPVAVYNRDGKFITTYISARIAAKRLGIKHMGYIVRSCRKSPIQGSVNSLVFRFIEDPNIEVPKQIDVSYLKPVRRSKAVTALDEKGNSVQVFESIRFACDTLHITRSLLATYLRHNTTTDIYYLGNYNWRYATKEDIAKHGQTRHID